MAIKFDPQKFEKIKEAYINMQAGIKLENSERMRKLFETYKTFLNTPEISNEIKAKRPSIQPVKFKEPEKSTHENSTQQKKSSTPKKTPKRNIKPIIVPSQKENKILLRQSVKINWSQAQFEQHAVNIHLPEIRLSYQNKLAPQIIRYINTNIDPINKGSYISRMSRICITLSINIDGDHCQLTKQSSALLAKIFEEPIQQKVICKYSKIAISWRKAIFLEGGIKLRIKKDKNIFCVEFNDGNIHAKHEVSYKELLPIHLPTLIIKTNQDKENTLAKESKDALSLFFQKQNLLSDDAKQNQTTKQNSTNSANQLIIAIDWNKIRSIGHFAG